jgi:hypothetical protein
MKGLRKICLIGNKEDWDLALPYIAMGYKMSKHTSLSHFFPYFLLFGRHPIPPSSIATQMDQVKDLDSHYYILCLFANGQTKNLKVLRKKKKKPEGFAKEKKSAKFAMCSASQLVA